MPLQENNSGKLSFATLFLIAVALVYILFNISKWKRLDAIQHDITQYYAYLPAAFIYHDLKLDYVNQLPENLRDKTWTLHTETGSRVLKMPLGLAMLYLPFFLTGHLHAILAGFPKTGYSEPYQMWLCIGSVFYAMLGLILLRKLLLRWFQDNAVALALLTIVFATNLLYYTTSEGPMSHAYSFFLFAAFFHATIKWNDSPKWKRAALLGLLGGLIAAVRVTNTIIFILPVLYSVSGLRDLKERILFFISKWKEIFVALICFLLVYSPQLLYWKYATGQWFYYSYQQEGFFFTQPQITNGFFSFRKGWLIYTPIMLLSLVGFFFLKEKLKNVRFAVAAFFLVNIYIVFSWWCWWYGGSYGMRALIESYAVLAIPLTAFYSFCLRKSSFTKYGLLTLILLFTTLNCIQTWQYRKAIIHWDGMTRAAYLNVFLKFRHPENHEQFICPPNYNQGIAGTEKYPNPECLFRK